LGDRAARRIAVALIAGALSTLLIGRHSDIDLLLADAVFDAASNTFPWRDAWLTDTFGHVILKRLLTLAALGFIGVLLSMRSSPCHDSVAWAGYACGSSHHPRYSSRL
jgi:membrane-associated PAP2 superfamily phosphatase